MTRFYSLEACYLKAGETIDRLLLNILQIYFCSLNKLCVKTRLYCRHYERTFSSPEEELLYFLERVAKPGWRWPAKPRPPEHHKNKGHERHGEGRNFY